MNTMMINLVTLMKITMVGAADGKTYLLQVGLTCCDLRRTPPETAIKGCL